MCAKTTAAACSSFKEHRMWLNGEEVPFEENPRAMRCLKACKLKLNIKKLSCDIYTYNLLTPPLWYWLLFSFILFLKDSWPSLVHRSN